MHGHINSICNTIINQNVMIMNNDDIIMNRIINNIHDINIQNINNHI